MITHTPSIFDSALAAGKVHYGHIAEEMACAIYDVYQEQKSLSERFERELNQLITATRLPNGSTGLVPMNQEHFLESSRQLLAEYVNETSDLYARSALYS
jgi:hypothetical protein